MSAGRQRRAEPRHSGELALIDLIRRRAAQGSPSLGRELQLGIGDDCAILRSKAGEEIVVTTDFCIEDRHFRRDWHPANSAGHRTLARGLSDLAAMGARPVAAFLSLALPAAVARESIWLPEFLDGLLALAARARVPLAGGDTSEAPGEHILADIVLLGAVPAGRALRRDGARAGDRLFCTGALGGAAAELQQLAKPGRARPTLPGKPKDLAKLSRSEDPVPGAPLGEKPHPQLFPEPRLALGLALLRKRLATAAIDLSDGLSTDLRHLCEASGVAAEVSADQLPLHSLASALGLEQALDLALNGGEDYELLFTASTGTRVPKRIGKVPVTEIGRILPPRRGEPSVILVNAGGKRMELPSGGWEHLV